MLTQDKNMYSFVSKTSLILTKAYKTSVHMKLGTSWVTWSKKWSLIFA